MENNSPWRRILLVGRTAFFVVVYGSRTTAIDPVRYGTRAAAKKAAKAYRIAGQQSKICIVKVKTRQAGRYIPYYVRDDELYLTRNPLQKYDQLDSLVYREEAMKKLPTT